MKEDRDNVSIEVLNEGDDETFPRIGDCVRCHYSCVVQSTGVEVESTRKKRHKAFEFVIGLGQVVRGFDRGVLQMSFGERARLTVPASWAWGERGFRLRNVAIVARKPSGCKLVVDTSPAAAGTLTVTVDLISSTPTAIIFDVASYDEPLRLLKTLIAEADLDEKRWPARQLAGHPPTTH